MRKVFLPPTIALLCLFVQQASAQNTSPYWSLAGNSNATSSSKLGTTNTIPLRFYTKNLERLRIDTGGRVGIGTTAPLQKLHVAGTGVFTGNVGIGTTSPTKKLHVVGTSLFTSTLTVSNGGLSVKNTTGSLGNAALDANGSLYGITSQGGNYGVYASSTSGTGLFGSSTNNTGVYGVGAKYGVYGSSTITTTNDGYGIYGTSTGGSNAGNSIGVYGVSTSTGFHSMGVLGVGNTLGVEGSSQNWGVYGVSTNAGYGVYGVSSSAYSANGSVGVYGNAYYGVRGDGAQYGVYGSGSQVGVYGGANDVFGVYGEGTTGVYGKGTSFGVFGIGNGSGSYAGYFSGPVYSTGGYTSSDRKLKKNIADFTSAMDIIGKLQPKSYEFRQDGNYKLMNLPEGKHYGLIAQDVEQVLPNLVKDTKFDTKMVLPLTKPGTAPTTQQASEVIDFKAVNYTELIPIVIKGMQEQEVENKALKAQVAELRQMVLDMKNATKISLTKGTLNQATPNPASGFTVITYTLPEGSDHAQLLFTDVSGKMLRSIGLTNSGIVEVNTSALASGTYNYTLFVNGQQADTKRLIITK